MSRVPVRLLVGVVLGAGGFAARERDGDAASGAREGEVGPDARTRPSYVDAAGHMGVPSFFLVYAHATSRLQSSWGELWNN